MCWFTGRVSFFHIDASIKSSLSFLVGCPGAGLIEPVAIGSNPIVRCPKLGTLRKKDIGGDSIALSEGGRT